MRTVSGTLHLPNVRNTSPEETQHHFERRRNVRNISQLKLKTSKFVDCKLIPFSIMYIPISESNTHTH